MQDAAFGRTDTAIAERCLGISGSRYTGGRLENYLDNPIPEQLDRLAAGIHRLLLQFEAVSAENSGIAPFELAVLLEKQQGALQGLLAVE